MLSTSKTIFIFSKLYLNLNIFCCIFKYTLQITDHLAIKYFFHIDYIINAIYYGDSWALRHNQNRPYLPHHLHKNVNIQTYDCLVLPLVLLNYTTTN